MTVAGSDTDEFFYVRQDHFLELGATDGQRLAAAAGLNAFGPHPVGATVKVRLGRNYYFFAVCHSAPEWATKQLRFMADVGAQKVTVACPA